MVLPAPLAPVTMNSGKSGTGSRVPQQGQCRTGPSWRSSAVSGPQVRQKVSSGGCSDGVKGGSGAVEGFAVGERATQPGLVLVEDADLEVRLPFRPRRGDLVDGAELESEPVVIGRVAEERHQRLAERVGRAQDGVHERAADAVLLAVRTDGQRAERAARRRELRDTRDAGYAYVVIDGALISADQVAATGRSTPASTIANRDAGSRQDSDPDQCGRRAVANGGCAEARCVFAERSSD